MAKPVYSIGARLIDSDGNTELSRIQILDDSITIKQPIVCKEAVSARGDMNVSTQLSANTISISGSLDASDCVTLPSSVSCDSVEATAVNTGGSTQYFNITENGAIEFTGNVGITAQNVTCLSKNLVFPYKLEVTGKDNNASRILPTMSYDHNLCGSIWLLWYTLTAGGGSSTWLAAPGCRLHYNSSEAVWYIQTNGILHPDYKLGALRECALNISGYYIQVHRFNDNINTSFEFRNLTPLYYAASGTGVTLAVRVK